MRNDYRVERYRDPGTDRAGISIDRVFPPAPLSEDGLFEERINEFSTK